MEFFATVHTPGFIWRFAMNRLFVILLAFTFLASCAMNPVSGERELALVSESQEIEIGRQSAAAAESQLGLVEDPRLQDYVQRLGTQLAEASERPSLPWTFRVVDDPTPNAFAAPGGFIFVTRGLLALMGNEAEFVSVLGHEIGHVTARHSVSRMSRQQLAQIGLGVGAIISPQIAKFSDLAAGGLQVLFLSYGRDDERQADDLGYRYALTQNYDVREMVNVFASLQHSAELAGRSPIPTWLASHPNPAERIVRIEKRLETLPAASQPRRIGEDAYMTHIDGLMYGTNPRNGYFEENRFLHPGLAFRLDLPEGWQTQNLAQFVVGGSPANDAIIQLSIVPGGRSEAADTFFAQEGLVPGRAGAEKVNGLGAIIGRFEAQTEQGKLGGIAAFITLAERTYQIVAYTPAEKLSGYENVFRRSINSFDRLTDRDALARQPSRLEIVRLPRSMTLTQFNRTYPSTIPLNELVVINQLSGPDSTMPARYPAKRVTDH
ncbi:MAG: M48 family metalloprotease [Xanthomonadales bacterium]|nr:M48 family metalloprotease [Xanthomonadales bacterium]